MQDFMLPCPGICQGLTAEHLKCFYHLAGLVRATAAAHDIRVRWGGDWDGDWDLDDQTFMDLAHFELLE